MQILNHELIPELGVLELKYSRVVLNDGNLICTGKLVLLSMELPSLFTPLYLLLQGIVIMQSLELATENDGARQSRDANQWV